MSTHLKVSKRRTKYQIEGICETTLVVAKFQTIFCFSPSRLELRGTSNLIKAIILIDHMQHETTASSLPRPSPLAPFPTFIPF